MFIQLVNNFSKFVLRNLFAIGFALIVVSVLSSLAARAFAAEQVGQIGLIMMIVALAKGTRHA